MSSLYVCACLVGLVCISIAFFWFRNPGLHGPMGPFGIAGEQGPEGLEGPIGLQGLKGPNGLIGPMGQSGTSSQVKGPTGSNGPTGPTGAAGSPGLTKGPPGEPGPAGSDGDDGVQGPTGPAGSVQGPDGSIGEQGPSGPNYSGDLIPTIYASTSTNSSTATFLNSIDDGITWTTGSTTTLPFNPVTKMITNGTIWVATGFNSNPSIPGLYWSYDQIYWTPCVYNSGGPVPITFSFQKSSGDANVCSGSDICTNGTTWCAAGGFTYSDLTICNIFGTDDPRGMWTRLNPTPLSQPDYNVCFDALTWTGNEYLASNGSPSVETSPGVYEGGGSLWKFDSYGANFTNVATRMGTTLGSGTSIRSNDIGSKLLYSKGLVVYASNTNIYTFTNWTNAPNYAVSLLSEPVLVLSFASNENYILAGTGSSITSSAYIMYASGINDWTYDSWPNSRNYFSNFTDALYWTGKYWIANGENSPGFSYIKTSVDGINWTDTATQSIISSSNAYFVSRCITGTNVTIQRPSAWTLLSLVSMKKYGTHLQ